jgi:hypothetical protein
MNDYKDYFRKVAAEYYYVVIPTNVLDWVEGNMDSPLENDVESLYNLLISAYNKGRVDQYHND